MRVSGALTPLLDREPLTNEDMLGLLSEMLPPSASKSAFRNTQEADFSYAHGEKARFRGNAF
jgi:Tfp pilus assembly pilus retraction ATPase PilT